MTVDLIVHGTKPWPHPNNGVYEAWRCRLEAQNDQRDDRWLLGKLFLPRSFDRRAVCRKRHHRESSVFCTCPLRRGAGHPGAHHVHNALECDQSFSTSSGKSQQRQHETHDGELVVIRRGGYYDLARVGVGLHTTSLRQLTLTWTISDLATLSTSGAASDSD